jgi:hypothetical protein
MPDDVIPRLHFRHGIAAEHVAEHTYRWVDPVDGQFRGYVVATLIEYEPTIEAQLSRSRRQ